MIFKNKLTTGSIAAILLGVILFGYARENKTVFYNYISAYKQQAAAPIDSPDLKYPIAPQTGDHITDKKDNPFYLPDPKNVVKDVEYDPASGKYIVTEKVGGVNIKEPIYLTYEEYLRYTEKQERDDYFKSRANAIQLIEEKGIIPPISLKSPIMDRIFGNSKIEIKPQGNLELTLGGYSQYLQNPNIPIRNRRTGGFDFDMNINLNVVGKIGDKLQLGIKFNNQSGFDFDNQVKLGYTGQEDDIIKEIQLGNVSLPLNTRLITGSQALFGVRTKLQFGRLTWTSVISQQKSKKETILIESGAQKQNFEVKADQYEENRHFFLAQNFRDNYDHALSDLPNIKSVYNVTRIEVWVTNRNGATQNVRDIVAIADLGEHKPFSQAIFPGITTEADNSANNLYANLVANPNNRFIDQTVQSLQALGLQQGQDFEKTYARLLSSSEYTYNPLLGFISLNANINPNDVLAVAYQYQKNGQVFQVGEFSNEIPSDSNSTSKALFLKMLKGSTVRLQTPMWNLMMKNIYALGAYQVGQEDFRLNIFYNDPGAGEKMYLPRGSQRGVQLIKVLNLDNLNSNNDQQPDGVFDFIPGVTILTQNGKIIFPQKEPFGQNLYDKMVATGTPPQVAEQMVYMQLYDSTKFRAQEFPEFNRFSVKGQYRGTNNRDISLGAFNLPKGSVRVTAGGSQLTEGIDYEIDYNIGRITILNQGVLNSGQQIKVDFENNNLFGFQQRNLMGTRLDYRINSKFNIGATAMHLSERPFNQKVNIGEDPISNTILGADVKYETNAPWLTKALDKLPFYSTKEMSVISAYAEVAHLLPGHAKAIGKGDQGQVYLDDFEGASSSINLISTAQQWKLASTPRNMPRKNGSIYFPEADSINSFKYGFNRALMSWYRIDNTFYSGQAEDLFLKNSKFLADHRIRLINLKEIYPNRNYSNIDPNVYPLDLQFHPRERGQYNYESSLSPTAGISAGVNPDGSLREPQSRWGGVMRALDNTDLEANNIEYIEFWMLDPFANPGMQNSLGGKLYFQLGSISEDILRDSRMQYENGLGAGAGSTDRTKWGNVPKQTPLVFAFDNDEAKRPLQDVGFDGFSTTTEKDSFTDFINWADANLDVVAAQTIKDDPSNDNYIFYSDDRYKNVESDILKRYKYYSMPEGNSPILRGNQTSNSATSLPDYEDLNKDYTLNENEEYFQYEVELNPQMDVGTNKYIVSVQPVIAGAVPDNPLATRWIQFRIPIREPDAKVGNIPDFKSIQFMRMLLTGWSDTTVVIRFGSLEMIRNQWRTYRYPIDPGTDQNPTDNDDFTTFSVQKVSIEENSAKTPVNYILPPGIDRTYGLAAQSSQTIAQNEQSLSLRTCGLKDGKSKAVFKTTTFDLRRYKRLKMFVSASRIDGELPVQDNDVTAFLRMGTDFKENYYQYETPLTITPDNSQYKSDNADDREKVWPANNRFDIDLQELVNVKMERNAIGNYPKNVPYTTTINGKIITIVGNPDIGALKIMMLGIKNPLQGDPNNPNPNDDGLSKCVEVWFNELRVADFDQKGGTAAVADLSIKLADFGKVNITGGMHTKYFGQVEQKLDQRFKDDFYQYNVNASLQLGKLLPAKAGIQLPFWGGINQTFSTPEFDPYQLDITSKNAVAAIKQHFGTDSARRYTRMIQTINTRRGYNFTGVRFMPDLKLKQPRIYDPANFSFTYAFNEIAVTDPFTQTNSKKNYFGQINWSFAPQAKEFSPFKKVIKSKSKWLDIIRDFNFNLMPSTLSFSTDMIRQYDVLKIRSFESNYELPTTYFKLFKWNRSYNFKYNPFKSLSFEYGANNQARIDEPDGAIDTKAKKDVLWNHIKEGGRNTNFAQNLSINYTLPINKIPLFDFITANASLSSSYTWLALPLIKDTATNQYVRNPLGNTISNSMNDRAKVDMNFKKIYDKVPFLKNYSSPNPTMGDKAANDKKREAVKKAREKIAQEIDKLKERKNKLKEDISKAKSDASLVDSVRNKKVKLLKNQLKDIKKQIKQKKQDFRSKQAPTNPFISILMRPLLALRRATIEYKETKTTVLPGFMPNSQLLGNDIKQAAPGYGFALLGLQPGDKFILGTDEHSRDKWLDNAATRGWMSKDTFINQKFTQTRQAKWDFAVNLEPFPDFKIDITAFQDKSVTHSQFFKQIDDVNGFQHLNPMDLGSYSISYLPVKTLFNKYDTAGRSDTYDSFDKIRMTISQRLGDANPNSNGVYFNPSDTTPDNNYRQGYGPKSQDVLIPAFLAAITGADPRKVNLNPLKALPMPNWRISYSGLTKIKWLQKIFTNINITHGYSSTLTINNYLTNLNYAKDANGHANVLDTINGNYLSAFNMLNVTVNEQFSPLIGIDVTTVNKISLRFDYKKSRTMTMTLSDYQIIENNSTAITAGIGYGIKGLRINFIKIKGKPIKLENELKFRLDCTYRDQINVNNRIDNGVPTITGGATTLTISPAVDYVINNRINVRLFADYSKNTPKMSTSFPVSNFKMGLQIRLSLVD